MKSKMSEKIIIK